MVAIHPFAALRYDATAAGDLSGLIAPPYDVIDPDEQERLYRASEHNIIRLILGKQSAQDTDADNRYTRARRDFDGWRAKGILRQDAAPALYVIEQAFQDGDRRRSRLGFIALLGLEGDAHRQVYRHEATLAAPKEDRTKLLAAVPANLEPIFCVYPDAGARIQALLRAMIVSRPPTAEAMLSGEPVNVWAVADPGAIQQVAQALAGLHVLIADGHHRFEVACASRARYGAMMSYFVSMEDPGLRVRSIHRLLPSAPMDAQQLGAACTIEPASDLAALQQWLSRVEGPGRFGYYDGQAFSRIMIRPEALARWLMAPAVPLPVATLDVSLLHGLLLPAVGVDGAVRYLADAAQAVRAVQHGEGRSAWLLRGIPLAQVYALAAQGMTLAPKSTYFYPKVPSGLTIHLLAETGQD